MICVPLAEPTLAAARRAMLEAAQRADLVELRLDQLDDLPDAEGLADLLKDRPCPVIVTNRPEAEGGGNDWPDEVRIKTLQAAIELGADYVDVELDLADRIEERHRTKLIVSYHNFTSTPLDLPNIYSRIVRLGADVVKIATTANSIIDNLRLFDVLRHADVPCIGLCMGEAGLISRVLCRKFGGMLTFAPMDRAKATAPGQVSLDELVGLYHYRSINSETQVYGVIGHPIGHSISPHIHNAAFRSLGINAVYLPLLVQGDVCNFIEAFRGIPVNGYSITIPHKQAAMRALDEVDPVCRQIGAVNTVVNRKGRLHGSNTDWSAAVEAIEVGLGGRPLAGKRVALVGAGGTARALAFGLKAKEAQTCIYNRTEEKARALADEVGCDWAGLEALAGLDADVLAHTTSVGMYPNVGESVVPDSALKPGMVVFDAVYNPTYTRLLCQAEEAGCVTVTGLDMFVNQAVQQFKAWTGLDAPRELMEAVARENLAVID
ncbi:MAG: shikimate dehydrogenase [Planctomycetota bacterium]